MSDEQAQAVEGQSSETQVQNPAGEQVVEQHQDTVDWKAMARLHEDREKENAARARDLEVQLEALKPKAARVSEIESLSESQIAKALEAQKAAEEERDALKSAAEERAAKEAHDAEVSGWKSEAAKKFGVPVDVIAGDTEDAISAHAEKLAHFLPHPGYVATAGQRPSNNGGNSELRAFTKQLFHKE